MSWIPIIEYLQFDSTARLHSTKTPLTNAQIKALPTTGVPIVPAIAGKIIVPKFAIAVIDATAGVYTNVNAAGFINFHVNAIDLLSYIANDAAVGLAARQLSASAKIGATAGWALGAADNLPYLATLPASQSGSTLVLPVTGLRVGDTITGFRIVAQVESAGGTVTIDAILRAVTNAAADPTDAAIGTGMTQVSVTADTAVSQVKTGLTEVVASGKTYYLLITATTGASTDVILQACEVTTIEGAVADLTTLLATAAINAHLATPLARPDDSSSAWYALGKAHTPTSTLINQPLTIKADNNGSGDFTGGHASDSGYVITEYLVI